MNDAWKLFSGKPLTPEQERAAMNELQDKGLVSDEAVTLADVPQEDLEYALSRL